MITAGVAAHADRRPIGTWRAETGTGRAVVHEGRVGGRISLRRITPTEGSAKVSYRMLPPSLE
ncbi:hypothetical protein Drose_00080 [Dactylosporangium roseum]|uniref:Uncharacterized protein n=1 Tax=Dactylosporangium roseum TaxID=47989 RepID=A0ABY5Z6Z8_9ACTN|nr:hypothetical protein [Dactylosporangium roseum]UWZ36795.1 hypothetical protein Drose_00080 [Dactylosporangium roseum]